MFVFVQLPWFCFIVSFVDEVFIFVYGSGIETHAEFKSSENVAEGFVVLF